MNKYILFSFFVLSGVLLSAQNRHPGHERPNRDNDFRKNIKADLRGGLRYEDDRGMTASLSTDIFHNKVYKDNRNNEISYSKEVWNDVFPIYKGDEYAILNWLVRSLRTTNNNKEKYKRDIFGYLQYENDNGLKASLSKDIFDNKVYKDSKGNEAKYSKEYWPEIYADFDNNEVQVFFWMMDQYQDKSKFQEEYSINIFDNQEYKNSLGATASMSKDVFENRVYKDSFGNKIEYTPKVWQRMVQKYGSENKCFMFLVSRSLFESDEIIE